MSDAAEINATILAQLDKNSTIGIGYVGVVVSSTVYGITCVQTFQYYQSARAASDITLLRILARIPIVSIPFVCYADTSFGVDRSRPAYDSIQESFAIHVFYFYLIDNFANPSGLLLEVWSMPAGVLTNAVILLMVKMFLTMRVWRLSGYNAYVTSVCVIVNLARFVMNVSQAWFKDLFEAEAKPVQRFDVAGLALEVAADVVVPAALVYYLVISRTGIRRSDDILSRLITLTVTTGMLSTCVAIANLVSYIAAPDALYVLFFDFLIAKFDANALMTSLNSREFILTRSVSLSLLHVPADRVPVWQAGCSTTMGRELLPYGIELKVDADGAYAV
ncbi:hypothetical protein LXA43DRAFT_1105094 [Ganoderma leucocontextum]|nr:hypothetical protein LXA43DRAFT_1105094 [Ganoderma leucocontextum]